MAGSLQGLAIGGVVGAAVVGLVVVGARNIAGGGAPRPAPVVRPVQKVEPGAADAETALRQRGAYLMAAIGCNDCHSAHDQNGQILPGMALAGHPEKAPLPEWDPSMLQRGAVATIAPTLTAFAGPWGVSVAPNLTPDKETGIGNMTADQLVRSWKSGKHWKYDRPVLPPMPVQAFSNLTDEDIRSIYAYLMSMPPVKNRAPESILAPARSAK
jgi:cytochrome c553